MKKLSFVFVLIWGFFGWPTLVEAAEAAKGPPVLTVIGAVSESNRSAFDAFDDAFLNFHGKEFEKAFVFDRAALEALSQVSVTARAEGWPKSVVAKGPLLKDLMDAAGVPPTAQIALMALDGYVAELESADRAGKEWVLAIEVDGKPLGVGGRGPAWLLHDTGDGAVTEEEEAQWVWSVFLIEVKE